MEIGETIAKKAKISLVDCKGKPLIAGGLSKPTRNEDLNDRVRWCIIHLHEVFGIIYSLKRLSS